MDLQDWRCSCRTRVVGSHQRSCSGWDADCSRILPLSAIVTPATLSVRPTMSSVTIDLKVPTLSFATFANLREGLAVQAPLTRLSKLVMSGVQIPPVQPFIANTSYTLELLGPSLQCGTPSSDVTENIDAIFEETGGHVQNNNRTVQQMAVYVAFTPFTPGTYSSRAWPLDDLGQVASNSSDWSNFVRLCLKGSQPDCSLLGPTLAGIPDNSTEGHGRTIDTANALWLRFGDERLSCSVQKTRYRLNFDARNPLTALKSYDYVQKGVFEADSLENLGSIVAIQPLVDILRGSTYMSGRWCFLSQMQIDKCTTALTYVESQTSIHETALTAMVYEKAGDIRNQTWAVAQNQGQGVATPASVTIPSADPRDVPLTRNLSLSDIIEEMSRNLTLSYFSDARYLSLNGTKTAVTTTMPINIYHYNVRNLVLAYAVAFGASTLAVAMGLYVFVASGYLNGTSNFSAILCATIRNPGLASLNERCSAVPVAKPDFPSMNASPEVLKMGLKYGALQDDHISDIERREGGHVYPENAVAFGLPGQVL